MNKQLPRYYHLLLAARFCYWDPRQVRNYSPLAAAIPLVAATGPRPLPMDQAFPYFVSIVDSDTLSVTWQIAPDHYLYRHQFGFVLQLPDDDGQGRAS